MSFLYFFFFCKQKTAYEMRISDWSSDVCSSDLFARRDHRGAEEHVVADLRALPRTRVAGVDHRLAHFSKDRLAPREAFAGAADHEGQRARVGGGDAARDGRVDRDEALGSRGFDVRARGRDVDRRAVDRKSTRLNSSH